MVLTDFCYFEFYINTYKSGQKNENNLCKKNRNFGDVCGARGRVVKALGPRSRGLEFDSHNNGHV